MLKRSISETDSAGYTLLEVMVVMAILGTILIPISIYFQKYLSQLSTEDMLINQALTTNAMENILATKKYSNNDTTIIVNNRNYRLQTMCSYNDSMLVIQVSSRRLVKNVKPLVLKRYVYLDKNM
jgi:prepilin-type N-terminal cleavage/methylation domain-containing protein